MSLVVDGRAHTSDESTFEKQDLSDGFYLGPTLFDHVTKDMSIYTDEIFRAGGVHRARSRLRGGARPAQRARVRHGVAIFTRDGDAARDFTSRVEVGMVGVNVPIPVPVAYHTFGGWKRSRIRRPQPARTGGDPVHTKTKTVTSLAVGDQGRGRVRDPDDELTWPRFPATSRGLDEDDRVLVETTRGPQDGALCPRMGRAQTLPDRRTEGGRRLGMGAVYCGDDVGGSGLRRLDGVRIFEQLACADPAVAAFLSIPTCARR